MLTGRRPGVVDWGGGVLAIAATCRTMNDVLICSILLQNHQQLPQLRRQQLLQQLQPVKYTNYI